MLLKYFYDEALAHASYMVGCQKSREAVIVDPGRDIQQYLDMADKHGMTIIGVAETHIHADYVSGARELADRVNATLYVSDEGPAEWKYHYLDGYASQLLTEGDTFTVGKIKFEVMHTPGHTPESISFILTDQGGGADKPMGIFTGDFVFVGSIGRPDLLEEAAGIENTAEPGARELFHSAERFKTLPDYLQVWPAHGAGSACGKGLGAIPSSTVGYEKLFNPALQYTDEDAFVEYILSDQPPAPKYFALMKRVNKEGPVVLGDAGLPEQLDVANINAIPQGGTLLDVRPSNLFAEGHVPGSINIPLGMVASWAGWLLDYSKPLYLIAPQAQVAEVVRVLRKIGVEDFAGVLDTSNVRDAGAMMETYENVAPQQLAERISSGEVTLVDVRTDAEWNAGHIAQANHQFLGRLPDNLDQISREQLVVLQCQSGVRSAVATSVLQAAGYDVVNMTGGFNGWRQAGLPTAWDSTSANPQSCKV